jgi:hypothetical protein
MIVLQPPPPPSNEQDHYYPDGSYPTFSPFEGTPHSAQEEMDCKYPPEILQHMDNRQIVSQPGIYYGLTPHGLPYNYSTSNGLPNTTEVVFNEDNLLRFRIGQLENGFKGVIDRAKKQDEKLKSQEKVIEKLREMLYQQGEKIEGQERKIKGQERKQKGYEYRVRKRYNTRSGKN